MNKNKLPFEDALYNYYGIWEIAGDNDNERILSFYHSLGHEWVEHDEVAWCAAAAGYFLQKHGYMIPELRERLRARAYITVMKEIEMFTPGRDFAIFWSGERDDGIHGHIGWPIRRTETGLWLFGGNQKNQFNISYYPTTKLIGYFTPQK